MNKDYENISCLHGKIAVMFSQDLCYVCYITVETLVHGDHNYTIRYLEFPLVESPIHYPKIVTAVSTCLHGDIRCLSITLHCCVK